ncbi:MAG: hypothetical protein IAE94_14345 [Chthoniobacterales bacterium]|nr:hypothetical protein [Chthoniobacterales bacterium]
MTAELILIFGGMLALSGSAFVAFCWSVCNGQMARPREAALTIFDDDEPVGLPTDRFPSRK